MLERGLREYSALAEDLFPVYNFSSNRSISMGTHTLKAPTLICTYTHTVITLLKIKILKGGLEGWFSG